MLKGIALARGILSSEQYFSKVGKVNTSTSLIVNYCEVLVCQISPSSMIRILMWKHFNSYRKTFLFSIKEIDIFSRSST